MICPKCGNEFEGTNCPKCDAPAILVNASDYERRRREWEKRQKLKNEEEGRKRRNREDMQRIASELANTDYKKVISSGTNSFAGFVVKHKKSVIAALVLLLLAFAAVFAGIRIYVSANSQLYVSDGSSIYKGEPGNPANALCAADAPVYNKNRTTAYMLNLPDGIDKNKIISSMCSDNGRYFAALAYEEDGKTDNRTANQTQTIIGESNSTAVNGNALSEGTYTLYAWAANQDYYAVSSDKKEKTIQNVSDNGLLVFTDTEYMNEGVIRSVSLKTSDIAHDGAQLLYSEDVSEFLITKECCVWLENDGSLYKRAFGADESAVRLAEDIKQIYAGTKENVYSHKNAALQPDKVKSFIYANMQGEFVRVDISDKNSAADKYLFTSNDNVEDIIYESEYGCAYAFSRDSLKRYTQIPVNAGGQDNKERKTETVSAVLTAKDFFYTKSDSALYFVTGEGTLKKLVHKGKSKFGSEEILNGVSAGTLTPVLGADNAFSCIADGRLYYVKSGQNKAVLIKENVNANEPVQVCFSGGKIYTIVSGTLYCVPKDGGDARDIGKAREIWIGRISSDSSR